LAYRIFDFFFDGSDMWLNERVKPILTTSNYLKIDQGVWVHILVE